MYAVPGISQKRNSLLPGRSVTDGVRQSVKRIKYHLIETGVYSFPWRIPCCLTDAVLDQVPLMHELPEMELCRVAVDR